MLDKKMKIKFLLFKYKYYALIYFISGLFAFLINKEIETILFFISYINLRYLFPKTFHHSNFYHCIFWSITMMINATYLCIPRNISILSAIPIAYLAGFILYKIKDYNDFKDFKSRISEFNIKNCSKYELIKRCKKSGFSKEDIKLAIYMFYDKLSAKSIAILVFLEEQTVRNKKTEFKKRLLDHKD